jgi:hypothetical protein
VAFSGKDFSEGQQLAVGCSLHQVRCRLGAVADQLRGADQLVLGGLTVLRYDGVFDMIASVTGQPVTRHHRPVDGT